MISEPYYIVLYLGSYRFFKLFCKKVSGAGKHKVLPHYDSVFVAVGLVVFGYVNICKRIAILER